MSAAPLILIDLSSIAYPLWHLSGNEPDPNWTSTQILAKVHALASGQPHVAICVDGPNSRAVRLKIDPTYKAQRDTAPAALYHQIGIAIARLREDGFPIWQADGYEADDVIASAVVLARGDGERRYDRGADALVPRGDILIVTADKDLCQLVGPRVTIKHALKGDVIDESAVVAKFGVRPDQMGDYLALVGDASDNIKGAKGIGEKRAVALLAQFGTLAKIMATGGEGFTPAIKDSLVEFSARADAVRSLIALRTDVPVRLDEAFVARVATSEPASGEPQMLPPATEAMMADGERTVDTLREEAAQRVEARLAEARQQSEQSAALVPQVVAAAAAPAEWSMQLEPRSMHDAWMLAQHLHRSALFSAYGTPSAVLSTILAGRELGLQAMGALRAFHIIEGKPTLSAAIIQALVVKSPQCEYFRCTERTPQSATFVTKRKGAPEMALTFTIEEAKLANGGTLKAGSGWVKNPADMCVARAATKLARLVYPDVVSNLYAPEEFA